MFIKLLDLRSFKNFVSLKSHVIHTFKVPPGLDNSQ
jgi:hypothetical protein